MAVLQRFEGASYPAARGRVESGLARYDGDVNRQVSVGLTSDNSFVTIGLADVVFVELEIDPIIATAVAEALLDAAITAWHRPDGPLAKKGAT
jgi:hypothetical protein